METAAQWVMAGGITLVFAILTTTVVVWIVDVRLKTQRTLKSVRLVGDEIEITGYSAADACDLIDAVADLRDLDEDEPDDEAAEFVRARFREWVPGHHVDTSDGYANATTPRDENAMWVENERVRLAHQVSSDGSVTEALPKVGDLADEPEYVDPAESIVLRSVVLPEGMAHAPGCITDHYGPGSHTCEPITRAEYAEWQAAIKDYAGGKMVPARPELSAPYAKLAEHAPKGPPSPHPRPKHALTELHHPSYYEEPSDDRADTDDTEA
jgi:hypothetical protein